MRRRYYGAGNFSFNYPSKSGTIDTGFHILVLYTILAVAAATAATKTTVEAAAAATAEAAWTYGAPRRHHRLAMALLPLTSYTNYGPTAPIPYIPTTANYGAESGIRGGSSP